MSPDNFGVTDILYFICNIFALVKQTMSILHLTIFKILQKKDFFINNVYDLHVYVLLDIAFYYVILLDWPTVHRQAVDKAVTFVEIFDIFFMHRCFLFKSNLIYLWPEYLSESLPNYALIQSDR